MVFHARKAEEQSAFDFGDVVEAISRKMIRRHPHVFADKDGRLTPSDVKGAWERIKAEERAERAAPRAPSAHFATSAAAQCNARSFSKSLVDLGQTQLDRVRRFFVEFQTQEKDPCDAQRLLQRCC